MQQIPIYARAQDLAHLLALKKAGATDAILENAEVPWNCCPFQVFNEDTFAQTSISDCIQFILADKFTAWL